MMKSPRCFANVGVLVWGIALASFGRDASALMMPEEAAKQTQVFMSLATREDVWGEEQLPDVQDALFLLANTLAAYQPVTIYVSPVDMPFAQEGLDEGVTIAEFQVDDLWMRDTSCIFSYSNCDNYTHCVDTYGAPVNHAWPEAPLSCVDFNFNGWGEKQTHTNDAKIAADVAERVGATYIKSELVMEGGSIEVDGEGTAIITRSSVINPNRNPDWTEADVEEELYLTLGIEKVIWTDGIIGKDITDAHIDFYARFTSPGVVVVAQENDNSIYDYEVTRQVIADLEGAVDARGRTLTVHVIDNPSSLRPEWSSGEDGTNFAASYINYYVGNDVVVMQNFGDSTTDAAAKAKLEELYPNRVVESLNVDPVAWGGGGIHCSTQQQPVGVVEGGGVQKTEVLGSDETPTTDNGSNEAPEASGAPEDTGSASGANKFLLTTMVASVCALSLMFV